MGDIYLYKTESTQKHWTMIIRLRKIVKQQNKRDTNKQTLQI